MRILYLSLSYVPSRRASSVHVMRMCAAFAANGHQVTLVTKLEPTRMETGISDDFDFYGVESRFEIVKLQRPSWKGGGLVFLNHLRRLLGDRGKSTDLVYCRDLAAARLAVGFERPVVFEAHGLPPGRLSRLLFRQLVRSPAFLRLVMISEALKRRYEALDLLPQGLATVVAHDAADPPDETAKVASVLRLADNRANTTHVGYVGHLYSGRGIDILMALARDLEGFEFHIVGGAPKDIARWRDHDLPPNVTFHGFVSPGRLTQYYAVFDILVAPYQRSVRVASGGDTTAWMSPMKIFEYMAAGKPIVASDLPVLREVLRDRDNALLVEADDVSAWRRALEELAGSSELAERLATRAVTDLLSNHTWNRRAEVVLDGL